MNCTTSDVPNGRLFVIKVIFLGMQPIGFGKDNQRLGGRRLYNIPKKLGYTRLLTREGDLNMIPHFFA